MGVAGSKAVATVSAAVGAAHTAAAGPSPSSTLSAADRSFAAANRQHVRLAVLVQAAHRGCVARKRTRPPALRGAGGCGGRRPARRSAAAAAASTRRHQPHHIYTRTL